MGRRVGLGGPEAWPALEGWRRWRQRGGGAFGPCGEAAGALHGRCRPTGGADLADWQRLAVRLTER